MGPKTRIDLERACVTCEHEKVSLASNVWICIDSFPTTGNPMAKEVEGLFVHERTGPQRGSFLSSCLSVTCPKSYTEPRTTSNGSKSDLPRKEKLCMEAIRGQANQSLRHRRRREEGLEIQHTGEHPPTLLSIPNSLDLPIELSFISLNPNLTKP